jgi:hypothetical protein
VAARGGAGAGRRLVSVAGGSGRFPPVVLLRPAEAARGAASGGGVVVVLVVLSAAAAAGRRVEAGGGRCGRALSATSDSAVGWRMDPAAACDLRWRFLSAVRGTASPAVLRSFGCGCGSECFFFVGSGCLLHFSWVSLYFRVCSGTCL